MNTPETTRARAKCAAQHLGLWAVEPTWFAGALAAVKAGTWPVTEDEPDEGPGYVVGPDGVATVEIVGYLVKGDSKYGGTSSVRTQRAIRETGADESVRGIFVYVDSPGGTVAGTNELAAAVRDSVKPIHVHIEDQGGSGAYWVASQAARISVNAPGEVGSIGTFVVVEDTSGAAEAAGVKVHVISTGPFKGAFVDGAPVTDEHLEYAQERVDGLNAFFQAAVKAGRGFDSAKLKAVSDGRMFGAKEAKALGLVDGIETQEEARARLANLVRPRGTPQRARAVRALRVVKGMGWDD